MPKPMVGRRVQLTALFAAALVACGSVNAAVPPVAAPPVAPSFSAETVVAHVRHLASDIGPRPAGGGAGRVAGGDAGRVAAAYVAEQLAGYGYAVERQAFSFPRFEERNTSLSVAPGTGDASGAEAAVPGPHAMYYSGAADVTGTLRFAGFGRPEDVAADSLAGAVALMERGADVTFRDKAERAAAAGAVAAVIYNSGPREFTGSLQVQQPVPVISISGDEGQRLRGLLEQGPVAARVVVDAEVVEHTTENVVGTRPSDAAPRALILGAHYDSVEVSPGANDNASGTAMVLELARVLGGEPGNARLTFAAFGAEELGLLGSAAYVERLSAEGRSGVAGMLNFDMVGVGEELRIGGDDAIARLAEQAAQQRGWQIGRLGGTYNQRSDQASFLRAGIPAVFFYVSDDPHYHTPTDVPENLSAQNLQRIGEVALDVVRQLARS